MPASCPTAASPAFGAFVSDAQALIADPQAIADRLGVLLAEDDWLAPEDRVPGSDTYRQHLLYVSPCRRMSVVSLVWRPGQRTPIHDHVAWCVVGVYRGVEREERYRLIEVDGERCLQPAGRVDAHPSHVEALVPPADDIHAVTAAGDELAISVHVYGAGSRPPPDRDRRPNASRDRTARGRGVLRQAADHRRTDGVRRGRAVPYSRLLTQPARGLNR